MERELRAGRSWWAKRVRVQWAGPPKAGVDAAGLLYDTGHRPPCCMQKGQGVAEDIHKALAADDACAADSCGLGLLQVGASQEAESSSYWQGVRETGTTCFFSNCPGRLNPVDCHHWRCVCQEGNKYNPADGGACVANDSPSARRMTGKTCWLTGCPEEYGSTQCVGHECVCDVGFEFQKAKGACVRAPGLGRPGPQPQELRVPTAAASGEQGVEQTEPGRCPKIPGLIRQTAIT
ncbi:unnamed protein product [Symbiodinium sp. CCMP2592]|nr:unnamed protein product [Symbiodinium sp. CCMP2592]